MKSFLLILGALVALTGCATGQTEYYAAETARHQAEAARWSAMARIAETGDSTVRAVAVVTMGAAGQGAGGQVTAAPRTLVENAVQALGILAPVLVQSYGIREQSRLGARQSDNSTAVALSTNSAFVGIAGKIQAPAASISTVTNSTASTTTDNHAVTGSYNAATSTRSTATSGSNNSTPTTTTNTSTTIDKSNTGNSSTYITPAAPAQ